MNQPPPLHPHCRARGFRLAFYEVSLHLWIELQSCLRVVLPPVERCLPNSSSKLRNTIKTTRSCYASLTEWAERIQPWKKKLDIGLVVSFCTTRSHSYIYKTMHK
ncbi:hypothetical protein ABKV19_014487, partial [Rosa sericea]